MSSKRSYAVHKSPSSEGFIEQMKATKSLTELQDLISTKDHATLACAFDSLLRQVSEGPSGEEARKKLKEISGEESEQGEVRKLSQVIIGKTLSTDPEDPNAEDLWLPLVQITQPDGTNQLYSTDQLKEQLRMTHCDSVCVKLSRVQSLARDYVEEKDAEAVFGIIFGGLIVMDTTVDVLLIDAEPYSAILTSRAFNAFKAVNKLTLQSETGTMDPKDFDEEFFVAAARRGIRTLEFEVTTDTATLIDCDIGAALAFGFAEPTAGGVRQITGVRCEIGPGFFSLLCEAVNELDGRQAIDFELKLWAVDGECSDFPSKYKISDETWAIDDDEYIKNGVLLKVFRNGCDLRLEVMTSVGAEPSVA